VVADSNLNKVKIKTVHKAAATSRTVLKNLQVLAEHRLNKVVVVSNKDKIKTPVATSGIIIQTGNRDKTATGQTEVAAREVSNKDKIKTPVITVGIKNNEVLNKMVGKLPTILFIFGF
jgi:hypothetical protein